MPHLHLSLQAGSDLILKRMKRRHLRDDAIRFCDDARARRPDLVLGADLIAGFPTETEAQFRDTLALIPDCGLTWLHVFPYSPRPGTPAARMPQVARPAVKDRAARLRAAGEAARTAWLAGRVGGTERALVETPDTARTEGFAEIRLPRPAEPGALLTLRVAHADAQRLHAA